MKKAGILLFLFLCSCTSNTIFEKPKDLIPRDTMVMLIEEMLIASSATFVKNVYSEREISYMPIVYEKYKIDSARYNRSNTYYISTIDEYIKLFEQVQDSLNKRTDKFKRLKVLKDSLRRDSLLKLRKAKKLKLDTTRIELQPKKNQPQKQ